MDDSSSPLFRRAQSGARVQSYAQFNLLLEHVIVSESAVERLGVDLRQSLAHAVTARLDAKPTSVMLTTVPEHGSVSL